MPFLGVLAHRQYLFQPQPLGDVGVNDANAWRLNPAFRYAYDKLKLALAQGLRAAPCGIDPLSMGLAEADGVFVKPITNMAGMSLDSYATTVAELRQAPQPPQHSPCAAGRFWCELLSGEQTSTDCLLLNGEVVWFAHTIAAAEKNKQRPIYWEIGVSRPHNERVLAAFLPRYLAGYTGLCNVELIGDQLIEIHLRGSNAFFDFYGADFIKAWGALMDTRAWHGLAPIPGGVLYSLFDPETLAADATLPTLPVDAEVLAAVQGVRLVRDRQMAKDRAAILYAPDLTSAQNVAAQMDYR